MRITKLIQEEVEVLSQQNIEREVIIMATKQNHTEEFLNQYKSLESTLRLLDPNSSVLSFEESLEDADRKDKLRICRQMRNYIQHHEDGLSFLSPTSSMVSFLSRMTNDLLASREKVGDKLYRLQAVSYQGTVREALERFAKSKRDWLPVVSSGKYSGVLTATRLAQAVYASTRKGDKLSGFVPEKDLGRAGVKVAEESRPLADFLPDRPEIVVVKNGKYLGIVRW